MGRSVTKAFRPYIFFERIDKNMPEEKSIRYSEWMIEPGSYEACFDCRKRKTSSFGVLMRRRYFGRDGESRQEYIVRCRTCGQSTNIHQSKLVTIKEWAGKQDPDYR